MKENGWINEVILDGLEMAYLSEGLETSYGTGVSAYYTPWIGSQSSSISIIK